MTFTVALMIAVSYWGARDIQTPCHPYPVAISPAQQAAVDNAPNEITGGHAYMAADIPACRILESPEAARDTSPNRAYITFCTGIVHEVGHIDGLGHDHGGVMSAGGSYQPWGCEHPHEWMARHRHNGRIVLTQPG